MILLFHILKEKLLEGPRIFKVLIAIFIDFFSTLLIIFLILKLNHIDTQIIENNILTFLYLPILVVTTFVYYGVYKTILRFIDLSFLKLIIKSLLTVIIFIGISFFLLNTVGLGSSNHDFESIDLASWFIGLISLFSLIITSRVLGNSFFSNHYDGQKAIIYGAGSAGRQLANALKVAQKINLVAFVDDNVKLQGNFIGDVRVYDPKKLQKLISKEGVGEVLVAMPSLKSHSLNNILEALESFAIKVRILPSVYELTQGKFSDPGLQEVNVADLLGREEVLSDKSLLEKNIKDKNILVTGAGGSIGSEISRQVLKNNPSNLILLDSNEFNLYKIKEETQVLKKNAGVYSILADVKNQKKLKDIMKIFKIDTIYHAAAYKHVSLVEENGFEAVSNNIYGTQACILAAIDASVETFVLISTDKAVRPTNIMGATKRYAEMILQSLSHDSNLSTKMTMVRFGNVIGSSGSAIPLFQKQIQEGGPLTVTHPEVTRYFMSIPEAAELVIQAGALGQGGDVFVLDMGEPIKIIDLAKRLIRLSGKKLKSEQSPEGEIEIIFTGLRPGEKLYEELLIGQDVLNTSHKKIYRAQEEFLPKDDLDNFLYKIQEAGKSGDTNLLKQLLKESVVGYTSEEEIVDTVYLKKNHLDH